MAAPVADSYSCASGGTISGGINTPPSWRPDAGTFANISLNTLDSVKPSGWPSNDIGGPFANWSGGVYAEQFSALGALAIHGSGHLSNGMPLWAGNWLFDLSTQLWVGRNVPAAPLLEGGATNAYGESTVTETLGHTYPPHTYDGLVYQPPASGGGSSGAMVRVFYAGSGGNNTIHKFDMSSVSNPPSRVIDNLTMNGASSSYPATAIDTDRGGFWLLTANGVGPLKFVHFSDWSVSTYSGIEYGTYGDNSLIYIPAPFDCLVGMGRANAENTQFDVYVCPIVAGVPQGFTKATTTGTPPSDGRSGGVWSKILSCVVAYEAGGSYNVHRLTPPTGSLTAGTWAWTHESLTGVSGATPSQAINPNNALPFNNGGWSRFIEVPKARCFVWCEGLTQPVQAWRLAGM